MPPIEVLQSTPGYANSIWSPTVFNSLVLLAPSYERTMALKNLRPLSKAHPAQRGVNALRRSRRPRFLLYLTVVDEERR